MLAARLLDKEEIGKAYGLVKKLALDDPSPLVRMNGILACGNINKFAGQADLLPLLANEDPFIVSAAAQSRWTLHRPIVAYAIG